MRPGGLTPEGYLGFVKRENLEQYSNTEQGEEPEGLEWQHCDQQIWKKIEKKLFVMWMSSRLSLQLAAHVRALHEPEESDSDADRVQKTWDSLRQKLEDLSFADVGGPDDLVTSTLVGYLVSTYLVGDHPVIQGSVFSDDHPVIQGSVFSDDHPVKQGSVFSDDRKSNRPCVSHDRVEQILHDELTAVQELAAWTDQPLVSEGFWSPEDLSPQQTQEAMQDDLWNALSEAHRSDAVLSVNVKRHGAGRVEGLPIVDPPTVLSRNQLIREDHPYYIAAGFLKLFPLGCGDYWAHVQERDDNLSPLSFWEWFTTTTNLSYRFYIFETSATASCGSTGMIISYYGWWKKSQTTTWWVNPVNNGIHYQPQLVSRISSINSLSPIWGAWVQPGTSTCGFSW